MGRCLGCVVLGGVPIATTQPSPFSSIWGQDLGLHHVWMNRREKKQAQLLCWCFMLQAKPLTATVAGEQCASCPAWGLCEPLGQHLPQPSPYLAHPSLCTPRERGADIYRPAPSETRSQQGSPQCLKQVTSRCCSCAWAFLGLHPEPDSPCPARTG